MIVEDQHILRELLTDFFRRVEGFKVVATCSNGDDAIAKLPQFLPDILLLDYQLPGISGLDVFRQAREIYCGIKVIFLSSLLDAERVRELTKEHAQGVAHKNISLSELADGLRQVFAGGLYFRVDAASRFPEKAQSVDLSPLSERELGVLQRIAAGRLNKEIAYDLNLSVRTVEKHRENIKKKLNARDTATLVRLAVAAKIV